MQQIFCVILSMITISHGRPEPPAQSSFAPTPLSSSYGLPAAQPPQPQYGVPSQQPTIHKHVYVHVPPPEQDFVAPKRPITFPPAQKHYKIVFIKAPAPPNPTAPFIPLQPQNEEKTLVYVLVKRPDEQPDPIIPTPLTTQPSKPEVYFIRYKTQKEAGGGPYPESIAPVRSINSDYGAPATSISRPPSSSYGVPVK